MADDSAYTDWQEYDGAERLSRLRKRITYLQALLSREMDSGQHRVSSYAVQRELAELRKEEKDLTAADGVTGSESGGRYRVAFRDETE